MAEEKVPNIFYDDKYFQSDVMVRNMHCTTHIKLHIILNIDIISILKTFVNGSLSQTWEMQSEEDDLKYYPK